MRVLEEQDIGFADWVAARGAALQRFAHLLGARDAADLVQEALAATYPRWDRLSVDGAEAYVRRAIVNASISRWRKDRHLAPVTPPEAAGADPTHAWTDAALAWQLCTTLPTTQRAAVVLRFYEDRSFGQIAEVLGCTESTARSHVHRALATLRGRLQEAES